MDESGPEPRRELGRRERLALATLATCLLAACMAVALVSQGRLLQRPALVDGAVPYRVDVNAADWATLSLVPGLGEVLSRNIVDYRADQGAFASLEGLLEVGGIGEKRLAELRPYLFVGNERTAGDRAESDGTEASGAERVGAYQTAEGAERR